MLDARAQHLLKTLIERYVAEGQPVGSRSLSKHSGLELSPAAFRHLEFLRLSDRRVLLIVVTPEGDVQNRILHTDHSYTSTQLIEATNFFNHNFAGHSFHAIRDRLAAELSALRDDIADLMKFAVEVGEGALQEGDTLVVTGERNLLNTQ